MAETALKTDDEVPFLWREYDAVRLNAVLNNPDVRGDVADHSKGLLDLSAAVANENNVLLMGEFGGCLCFKLMPGVYEVHTQVLPRGRGEWALDFVRAGMSWMFCNTDAFEIITRVPVEHKAARGLTIAAGMRREFTNEGGCVFREQLMDVDIYSIRIQDWATKADELVEQGRWVHDEMRREAKRLELMTQPHANDDVHNRYVGATFKMFVGGQINKAVLFYNRWALAVRHDLISVVSLEPLTIRFDVGLMTLENGRLRIKPC